MYACACMHVCMHTCMYACMHLLTHGVDLLTWHPYCQPPQIYACPEAQSMHVGPEINGDPNPFLVNTGPTQRAQGPPYSHNHGCRSGRPMTLTHSLPTLGPPKGPRPNLQSHPWVQIRKANEPNPFLANTGPT